MKYQYGVMEISTAGLTPAGISYPAVSFKDDRLLKPVFFTNAKERDGELEAMTSAYPGRTFVSFDLKQLAFTEPGKKNILTYSEDGLIK